MDNTQPSPGLYVWPNTAPDPEFFFIQTLMPEHVPSSNTNQSHHLMFDQAYTEGPNSIVLPFVLNSGASTGLDGDWPVLTDSAQSDRWMNQVLFISQTRPSSSSSGSFVFDSMLACVTTDFMWSQRALSSSSSCFEVTDEREPKFCRNCGNFTNVRCS